MPSLEDFPHVSRFEDIPISFAKNLGDENPLVAKASLDNLKNLFPKYSIDLEKNIDLLGISFNAAIVNVANKNGDVMDTQTAISMANTFSSKFLNKEHDRSKIIGHIVSAGFSSYGESNILYPMDIAETEDPFNIALGAVVYKIVDKKYAAQIEDSVNPESNNYQGISASWEIGLANYKIAMGSPNLKEAEIVSDPKYIEELKQYLTVYGGAGKYKGSPIYRLIGRECLALGCGLTARPAANVKSLYVHGKDKEEPMEGNEASTAKIFTSLFNNSDKNKNKSVTQNKTTKDMENIEQFMTEIRAHLLEKKIKEETVASISSFFTDKMKEADKEWQEKVTSEAAAKEAAIKEAAEIKASLEANTKELEAAKEKIAKIEAEAADRAAAELFSARMDEFNSEYELDDEDRAALAAELKTVEATDEAFAAFKKKMGVFMKDKNKEAMKKKMDESKASLDKAVEEKLKELAKASSSKLSEKELAAKALEEAKASKGGEIPNNGGSQGEQNDFIAKLRDAFSPEKIKDQVTIS